MSPSRLLCIVDDNADYRLLLQRVFERYFPAYRVRFLDGGHALLNELPQLGERPSLILLDRHMPGLDGHQALLTLKEHPTYRTIPVVMMSALANEAEIEGCYQAGANSFLLKSPDLASLQSTLSTVCQYWLELNQKGSSNQ